MYISSFSTKSVLVIIILQSQVRKDSKIELNCSIGYFKNHKIPDLHITIT
jgi:hypothetical protein